MKKYAFKVREDIFALYVVELNHKEGLIAIPELKI